MIDQAVHGAPSGIEKILQAAEARAVSFARAIEPLDDTDGLNVPVSNQDLVMAAEAELRRRHEMMRHLPIELCTNLGWTALLDLFVNEQILFLVAMAGCGRRWKVSDATAGRQIAALIEAGLAMRVVLDDEMVHSSLQLTTNGYDRVSKVLKHYA